jgi:hypothetical protein
MKGRSLTMVENPDETDHEQDTNERPPFPHPPWMVGVILALAVLVLFVGLADPIWLLIGSPCLLALVIYMYVKIETWRRKRG